MAIQPTSLISSAAFLQDIKNVQTKKTNDENKAFSNELKLAEQQKNGIEKSESVAVEIKTTEADSAGRRVDIKIDDQIRKDDEQQFNAVAASREAPVPKALPNQRPGTNLDISV